MFLLLNDLHFQIPFFCGMSAQCWEPGSEWALAQAKTNLVSRFLVVGVTEQFETFIEVRQGSRMFSTHHVFFLTKSQIHVISSGACLLALRVI